MPWKRKNQLQEWLNPRKIILGEKLREAAASVLPIVAIVLVLSFTVAPVPTETLLAFLVGAAMVILGIALFSLGADTAMTPIGERVGAAMTRSRKLWVVAAVGFIMGFIVTVSEPDLQVLAQQVPGVPNAVLIGAVAVGVGIFLVIAMLRILFRIPLNRLLVFFYIIVFAVAVFVPEDFLAIAFDSGGVTTGPMTVPFIMALGVGLSAVRSDRESTGDSFGLVALCSVGPILMVLLLGIFYHPTQAVYNAVEIPAAVTTQDVARHFLSALPQYAREVAVSILPVAGVFVVFQLFRRAYRRRQVARITVGFLYTVIGLILFLTGVNVGFAPVGNLLGAGLAGGAFRWLLVPIGMVIGYYIVKAEPAVQVLNEQVEDLTGGMVSRKMMNTVLSIGVACAVALSMVRVLTGLNIYWLLLPGYAAALLLSRRVPVVFVGIAFDSGGVASGPMTSTFLLPLAMGACGAVGGSVVTDAFGIVALVAMAPLVAIQIMGIVYTRRAKAVSPAVQLLPEDTVVDIEEES